MKSITVILNIGWMLLFIKEGNPFVGSSYADADPGRLESDIRTDDQLNNPSEINKPPSYNWDEFVTRINKFRQNINRGLPEIERDEKLMEVAQSYANDCITMIEKNQQNLMNNNLNSSNETLIERVFGKGDISPSKGYATQNLIMSISPLASDAEDAIENSLIHRQNLLGNYSSIGFGHSQVPCKLIISQDNTSQAHLICSNANIDSKLNIYVQVLAKFIGLEKPTSTIEKQCCTTTLLKPIIIIHNSKNSGGFTSEEASGLEPNCTTHTISKKHELYHGLQPDEPITDKESALRFIGQLTDKNPDSVYNENLMPVEDRYEYCQPNESS